MVPHLVQAEEVPRARHQWVDFDRVISARPQADQAADHQVAIRGVVIVLAAFGDHRTALPEQCPGSPVAVGGVKILINPGHHAAIIELEVVGACVNFEQVEVILRADEVLLVVVEEVGEGGERDGGGVGPARTIPLALVTGVSHGELGMPPLGGGRAKGCVESQRIHELLPGCRLIRIGEVKIPRGVTVLLARIGKVGILAPRQHHKELRLGIPELLLHQPLQLGGFSPESVGDLSLASPLSHARYGQGIAIHVAVDRGPVALSPRT